MRELRYNGHISDYLVKLQALYCRVKSLTQIFRDRVTSQMLTKIMDMMYTIGVIPMEDNNYLRVLELVEKGIEEKKWVKKEDFKPLKKDDKNKHKEKKGEKSNNKEQRDKPNNYKNNEGNMV
jgi:hypothetical protein